MNYLLFVYRLNTVQSTEDNCCGMLVSFVGSNYTLLSRYHNYRIFFISRVCIFSWSV